MSQIKEIQMERRELDKLVELKCVNEINNIHMAQLLSYLKTSNMCVGLILNFADKKLGIERIVNNY
jgi:GxxExxY protein